MLKYIFRIFVVFLLSASGRMEGQAYNMQWEDRLAGSGDDAGSSIEPTSDGGYIVACGASFYNTYAHDYRIIKLRGDGTVQWVKTYGGSGNDVASSIRQTADRGYIVTGTSNSATGDVSGNHGGDDIWVLKLDSTGSIQWERSFGGSANDIGASAEQTNDKGYIVCGTTSSTNGNISSNHGYSDYWAFKLDSTGIMQWQKTYGGTQTESATNVHQVAGGAYILAGYTISNDGDVIGNHGVTDYWILKLDSVGAIIWQKTYGGSYYDILESLQPTSDSGFVISGYSESHDGDFSTNTVNDGFCILKLDAGGMIQWIKTSALRLDHTQIRQCRNGGYIVSGNSAYFQQGPSGGWQVPIANFLKLDSVANVEWSKLITSSAYDQYEINNICQSSDSGYVFTGSVSGAWWVVKLNTGPGTTTVNTGIENKFDMNEISVFPNPVNDMLTISSQKDLPATEYDIVDALGRTILHGTVEGMQAKINIGGLVSGIYTLCIGSSRLKLVKQD